MDKRLAYFVGLSTGKRSYGEPLTEVTHHIDRTKAEQKEQK